MAKIINMTPKEKRLREALKNALNRDPELSDRARTALGKFGRKVEKSVVEQNQEFCIAEISSDAYLNGQYACCTEAHIVRMRGKYGLVFWFLESERPDMACSWAEAEEAWEVDPKNLTRLTRALNRR